MKVRDLIKVLEKCDPDSSVGYCVNGSIDSFTPLDEMIGVNEYADCVVLHHEIIVPK
ncbi:hypothetical protein [Paenibacillus polymyxa]|uniref:hypothetical protein n=1 Tax=Paenibacillus polymyxa TaxID=1406 RepID=UPI00287F9E2B|nr:hypothetical protein [Paenibacillus polymyxa]